jgi:hypothetical protein
MFQGLLEIGAVFLEPSTEDMLIVQVHVVEIVKGSETFAKMCSGTGIKENLTISTNCASPLHDACTGFGGSGATNKPL